MIRFILFIFLSLSASAFNITQIIDVEGNYDFKFDSNSNCFVSIEGFNNQFIKLDSDKNVVVQLNLTVYDIVINSKDDVYIFGGDVVDTIWLLKANTEELHPIFKYPSLNYITTQGSFIDEEDNILINTINGIVMLKPDLNIPIAIENLNSYYFYAISTTTDQDGNIYLSRMLDRGLADIVVITSTAKHQPVPYATVVEELKDEGSRAYEIRTDSNNNIIISVQNFDYSGKVKVLRNWSVDEILSQYRIHHYLLPETKNRTFLIAADPFPEDTNTFTCSLYFIDADAKVNRVDRIFDLTFWNAQTKSVSDMNDNMFFVNNNNEVLFIWNDGTEIFELFKSDYEISGIFVDSSDVVWVICYGVYYNIPFDSGNFDEYVDRSVGNVQVIKENMKTGEIYVASREGLFVLQS